MKPTITYPANNATVDTYTIQGKSAPNSNIYAYVSRPTEEAEICFSKDTFLTGGVTWTDRNGDFELELARPCSEQMTVTISTQDPFASPDECKDPKYVSEPVTFTYTGKFPGVCTQ